ncbi:hypothetical protein ACFS7Z_22675 [Pontibacter toksunensis]|uniref:Uncharacterized protein n=1 Tax=Pontibacter toksunensis TaxID=1332631 RepID=A0ABW6C3J6_9BACT
MKRVLTIVLCFWAISAANAQYIFETAGEKSGIITADTSSGYILGYEFSSSEALFNYERSIMQSGGFYKLKDSSLIKIEPSLDPATLRVDDIVDTIVVASYKTSNYRVAIPIAENTRALFSSGEFNPGLELVYENVWSPNALATNIAYHFIRFSYEIKENSFGSVDTNDSIKISQKVSHTVGITPGINWVIATADKTDNLIIALSLPVEYNVNPVANLSTKDFITDYTVTTNGVIQKSRKAYSGTQENFISLTPKLDFAYTPLLIRNDADDEIGPRLGFIGSLASIYNTENSDFRYNFSIGPSLHPKWSSSSVLATIQAELIDFTDVSGDKGFEDIFAVKFFVGIPLSFQDQ